MGKSCVVCKIVGLVVGLGALNWGLVAFFDFNIVTKIFGDHVRMAKVVYGVVALAGVIKLISLVKPCPCTKKA